MRGGRCKKPMGNTTKTGHGHGYKLPHLPKSEQLRLIDEWVIGEQERYVLKRHLFDKISYERLAEEMDISVSTVKRYYNEASETYFGILGQDANCPQNEPSMNQN